MFTSTSIEANKQDKYIKFNVKYTGKSTYIMATSSKVWPKVMSSVHQNRPCGPCFLCKKEQPRYDHFSELTVGERRFLEQHFGSAIPNDSCLCRAHGKETKKYQSDPEYIPVQNKNIEATHSTTTSCIYPGCTATSYKCRIIMPSKEMLPIFSEALNT